jgi:hypothetical protein
MGASVSFRQSWLLESIMTHPAGAELVNDPEVVKRGADHRRASTCTGQLTTRLSRVSAC